MSRPKPSRPVRYWPGKAPAVETPGSSSSDSEESGDESRVETTTPVETEKEFLSIETEAHDKQDRRLLRLLRENKNVDSGGRGGRSRVIEEEEEKDEIIEEGGDGSEEGEEDVVARRNRLRQQALEKRRHEEDALDVAPEEEDGAEQSESEDSSEYTTDSEDDLPAPRVLLKPIFTPKVNRETILEKERLEAEAAAAEALKEQQAEERKKESHDMVAEELLKEQEAAKVAAIQMDIDDTDGLNEEEEYAGWKLRELRRIKREREEREAREQEQEDAERRRLLTDEEIMASARRKKKEETNEEKAKYRFLQKYYHKGAFFVDDQKVGKALESRDFSAPTLEDKFDKAALPTVMQVKRFGRAGQTKYTHLADQDTSKKESPWFQPSQGNRRMETKLGGLKQSFQKPTAKRRKTDN
ncbi:splicing factor, Prp19-binding domain-containing protein [Phlyctochytrium arcticum]|nr:splicing factor, Prp19-binding domain-containing protein [Phlyctochytrium arcticum]